MPPAIESRNSWGHTARLGPAMKLPASEAWIHHTAMDPPDDFEAAMRAIERVGVQRFGRFSYSYAIHPTGRIGEGAGVTVGAHTKGHNSIAFGLVFMGNFQNVDPTVEALDSCRWLLTELQDRDLLRPGLYPTGGHRDNPASPSACPGDRLYPHVRGVLRVPWEEDEDVALSDTDKEWLKKELANAVAQQWYHIAEEEQTEAGFGHVNKIIGEVRRNVRRVLKAIDKPYEGADPDAPGGG